MNNAQGSRVKLTQAHTGRRRNLVWVHRGLRTCVQLDCAGPSDLDPIHLNFVVLVNERECLRQLSDSCCQARVGDMRTFEERHLDAGLVLNSRAQAIEESKTGRSMRRWRGPCVERDVLGRSLRSDPLRAQSFKMITERLVLSGSLRGSKRWSCREACGRAFSC